MRRPSGPRHEQQARFIVELAAEIVADLVAADHVYGYGHLARAVVEKRLRSRLAGSAAAEWGDLEAFLMLGLSRSSAEDLAEDMRGRDGA